MTMFNILIERIISLDSFLEPLYSTKIFWIFIAFVFVSAIAGQVRPINRKKNDEFEKEFNEVEKKIKKTEESVYEKIKNLRKDRIMEEIKAEMIESATDYEAGIFIENGKTYKIISE